MKKHASKPYNPNIAYVFYLAGFIESWGRGIEKICDVCAKEGFPASEEQIVRRPERVTEKELEIFKLLQEDPGYTYSDLAERLAVSRKTVSDRIKKLKEKGIIERIGSDTKGYWEILYDVKQ